MTRRLEANNTTPMPFRKCFLRQIEETLEMMNDFHLAPGFHHPNGHVITHFRGCFLLLVDTSGFKSLDTNSGRDWLPYCWKFRPAMLLYYSLVVWKVFDHRGVAAAADDANFKEIDAYLSCLMTLNSAVGCINYEVKYRWSMMLLGAIVSHILSSSNNFLSKSSLERGCAWNGSLSSKLEGGFCFWCVSLVGWSQLFFVF